MAMKQGKIQSTRIALLADVHGNLPALEAVLRDVHRRKPDQIWYLGDFLGYIPFPNEVIALLRDQKAVCIKGNYDDKVLAYPRKAARWKKTKRAAKLAAFRWNSACLHAENRRYLEGLPTTRSLDVMGITALLTHGSPDCPKEPLSDDTPRERLRELADAAQADLVACGHSHVSFQRRVNGTCFINPGSVGRPGGGDPRAAYRWVTVEAGRINSRPRRVTYDIERAGRAIHAAGLDRQFYEALRRGQVEIEAD
jgi:putative phosphoesterase